MSGTAPVPAFTMLGAADAAACEGDACLVPGSISTAAPTADRPPAPSSR